MEAKYTVVEPASRLSYDAKAWTEGEEDGTTINQTTEVTFREEDHQTIVTVVATIHSTGPKAGMAVEGMQQGFNQQLDKLAAFL